MLDCLKIEQDKFFNTYTPFIFGQLALQVGCLEVNLLQNSKVGSQVFCAEKYMPSNNLVQALPEYLPFRESSFDLVVMPHTLDFCNNPFQVLREASRVLRVNGRLLLSGFNGLSLWRLGARYINARFLSLPRLIDWAENFDLELMRGCFMIHCLPNSNPLISKLLNQVGDRWFARNGAVYCLKFNKAQLATIIHSKSIFKRKDLCLRGKIIA